MSETQKTLDQFIDLILDICENFEIILTFGIGIATYRKFLFILVAENANSTYVLIWSCSM